MISVALEPRFHVPEVQPLDKPVAFTLPQLQCLIRSRKAAAQGPSPFLHDILHHVERLRHDAVTWALGLCLHDLMTWSAKKAAGAVPSLRAPLTFFKPDAGLWIPKVLIRVCPEIRLDPDELLAYHITCRRASIESLCITEEHIRAGYLESKSFKRAFNGAFFCDRRTASVFCPTLREWC